MVTADGFVAFCRGFDLSIRVPFGLPSFLSKNFIFSLRQTAAFEGDGAG
jgi:hypothetical protein